MNKKKFIAVFDIDGCCIDSSERWLRYGHDRKEYEDNWELDKPIPAGTAVYLSLMKCGIFGLFLTARTSSQSVGTYAQLDTLFPGCEYELVMAPNPQSNHSVFKVTALRQYLSSNGLGLDDVLVCFDDNIDVVGAYRDLGLVAYQTAKGWS